MAKPKWTFRHFMRDGTEIKSGKDIPMTEEVMDTVQRALDVCETQLARVRGERGETK